MTKPISGPPTFIIGIDLAAGTIAAGTDLLADAPVVADAVVSEAEANASEFVPCEEGAGLIASLPPNDPVLTREYFAAAKARRSPTVDEGAGARRPPDQEQREALEIVRLAATGDTVARLGRVPLERIRELDRQGLIRIVPPEEVLADRDWLAKLERQSRGLEREIVGIRKQIEITTWQQNAMEVQRQGRHKSWTGLGGVFKGKKAREAIRREEDRFAGLIAEEGRELAQLNRELKAVEANRAATDAEKMALKKTVDEIRACDALYIAPTERGRALLPEAVYRRMLGALAGDPRSAASDIKAASALTLLSFELGLDDGAIPRLASTYRSMLAAIAGNAPASRNEAHAAIVLTPLLFRMGLAHDAMPGMSDAYRRILAVIAGGRSWTDHDADVAASLAAIFISREMTDALLPRFAAVFRAIFQAVAGEKDRHDEHEARAASMLTPLFFEMEMSDEAIPRLAATCHRLVEALADGKQFFFDREGRAALALTPLFFRMGLADDAIPQLAGTYKKIFQAITSGQARFDQDEAAAAVVLTSAYFRMGMTEGDIPDLAESFRTIFRDLYSGAPAGDPGDAMAALTALTAWFQ